MLFTVVVFAYGAIAAISLYMTVKEHLANKAGDRLDLILGGLACLVWPAAILVMLFALHRPMPSTSAVPPANVTA